jgi:hypothetical protein
MNSIFLLTYAEDEESDCLLISAHPTYEKARAAERFFRACSEEFVRHSCMVTEIEEVPFEA